MADSGIPDDVQRGGEVGGEDMDESGDWGVLQRELQRDAPELEREATPILKALLRRARVRKAMRSFGLPATKRPATA